MCIVRGHIRTKILSTKGRRKKHNFIPGITGYKLAIYHTERKINSFYLSEYFVVSFLCTIFAHINRTIKKHPNLTQSLLTPSLFTRFTPYHVHIAVSSFQSINRRFLFYNNVPTYTCAQARISLFFL